MKRMTKRIMALMLSFVMLIGFIPSNISNAESKTIENLLSENSFPMSLDGNAPANSWVDADGHKLFAYDGYLCFDNSSNKIADCSGLLSFEEGFYTYSSDPITLTFKMESDSLVQVGVGGISSDLTANGPYTAPQTSGITIKFDKNNDNASGTMNDVTGVENTYTLPVCTFCEEISETAKIFIGWSLKSDGDILDVDSINLSDCNEYISSNTLTLYAMWDDLKIIEQPSKENNYTVKTNESNLFGGFPGFVAPSKVVYKWYYCVEDQTPVALDVVKDLDKTLDQTYSQHAVITDANEEYFVYPLAPTGYDNDFPYTDFVDGIAAFYDGNSTYELKIMIDSEKIGYNDDISIEFESVENLPDYVNGKTPTTKIFDVNLRNGSLGSSSVNYKVIDMNGSQSFKVVGLTYKPKDTQVNIYSPTSKLNVSDCKPLGKYYAEAYYYTYTPFTGEAYGPSVKSECVTYEPAITPSHSSKTYKAKDEDKTAEKISGSGKKGSKRTIIPIEGKKVGRVTVTDKQGNKVDVTLNEDGTYSFIQPASDVNVEVSYVNREITLNIGSTLASVDDETTNLDVCPVIRNDRTMLPIRFVAENLGAKVEWNEKNPNYVLITRGDTKIEITLGSDKMLVNGKEVKLDSVAFAENDRTYLPVRAVSENLNAIVEWNEAKPMEVKIFER